MKNRAPTAATAAAPCRLESLEERQLFSAMGTMNVIDAGPGASAIAWYTLDGTKDYALAGAYNWTRAAANPGTYAGRPNPGQTFAAFCLEPDQEFPSGTNVGYTVVDLASSPPSGSSHGPMGAAKADQVRELWGRFHAGIGTDNNKAAAFQMAMWEIVTDTGKDLTKGAFVADTSSASGAAIEQQAQAWLNQLTGCGPKANLLALSSCTDQDQVFEVPPQVCNPLKRGMTATIGFWQNKNGQALLKSLNGGPNATNLGNWLATNFPNLWGANAGTNNLAGKTNTQIAAYFVSKFNVKGMKLDAQVLSVAFATYVTNASLAGNVAAKYGFVVSAQGTGAATLGSGSGGAALGLGKNATISVWQALKAADQLSAGGTGASKFEMFNGNATLRNSANTLFSYINEHGDI
ncbi:MAG TPA: hypothetical protein VH475_17020 [Tepidisphaeraceae bacterium]|jgi:hypothetical protein